MSTKRLAGKSILVTAVALIAAVLLIAPAWAQQAPIKWKAQTLWNAQERPQKTFEDFCKRVKVLTNGRLEIEPYPAGAIVPTNETLTAMHRAAQCPRCSARAATAAAPATRPARWRAASVPARWRSPARPMTSTTSPNILILASCWLPFLISTGPRRPWPPSRGRLRALPTCPPAAAFTPAAPAGSSLAIKANRRSGKPRPDTPPPASCCRP